MRRRLPALLTALLLAPAPAAAAPPLDTDDDGRITFEEVTRQARIWFDALDKDGDGALSEADAELLRDRIGEGIERYLERLLPGREPPAEAPDRTTAT